MVQKPSFIFKLVLLEGLEPPTSSSSDLHSNQLSYSSKIGANNGNRTHPSTFTVLRASRYTILAIKMVREKGLEPFLLVPETSVLPLNTIPCLVRMGGFEPPMPIIGSCFQSRPDTGLPTTSCYLLLFQRTIPTRKKPTPDYS